MKKVLVCALAVFFLMASCSTAFAATVQTVTTYNSEVSGEFTVTTYVTGATNGDKVTYLAYEGDSKDNVTFADQKTVSGGKATFSFSATPEDIAITDVLMGTTNATAINGGNADDLADNVRNVTITVDGNAGTSVTFPDYAENAFVYVSGLSISGKVVDRAEIGDVETTAILADGSIAILDNAAITDDCTINLVTRTEVSEPSIVDGSIQTARFATDSGDTLTVFAKISVNDEEFGIKVAKSEDMADAVTYKAYAVGSEGQFAVQLVNESGEADFIAENVTYYAQVYVGDVVSDIVEVELKN